MRLAFVPVARRFLRSSLVSLPKPVSLSKAGSSMPSEDALSGMKIVRINYTHADNSQLTTAWRLRLRGRGWVGGSSCACEHTAVARTVVSPPAVRH